MRISLYLLALSLIGCGQHPAFKTTKDDQKQASDLEQNPIIEDQFPDDDDNTNHRKIELCEQIEAEDCDSLNFHTYDHLQSLPKGVDILWVVDNSGSMSEEQNYLADNFETFINELSQSTIDFQIAVTTTDACEVERSEILSEIRCPTGSNSTHDLGLFRGDVLDANDPDLIEDFQTNALVGTNGSGFEHGLSAAYLGVSKSLGGEQSSELVREEMFLAVITVSDEEDDGIGLGMVDAYSGKNYIELGLTEYRYTEDDLISYLTSAKGEGMFSLSTITATADPTTGEPCTSAHSQPREVGTQYINAAAKTGGIVQSICESNWDSALAQIGADIESQSSQIVLPNPAIPASIVVYVDLSLFTEWSYVPASNAIKFNAGHVPATGSVIHVEYLSN